MFPAPRLTATELVVGPNRVVAERQPADQICTGVVLFDLEGELFFGSAPELEVQFDRLRQRTADGAKIVVLRLRRHAQSRHGLHEIVEQFLEDMNRQGVIVLLCGVREDFAEAMKNLRLENVLPPDRVFLQTTASSSTLEAVRRAYELLGPHACTSWRTTQRQRIEGGAALLHDLICASANCCCRLRTGSER